MASPNVLQHLVSGLQHRHAEHLALRRTGREGQATCRTSRARSGPRHPMHADGRGSTRRDPRRAPGHRRGTTRLRPEPTERTSRYEERWSRTSSPCSRSRGRAADVVPASAQESQVLRRAGHDGGQSGNDYLHVTVERDVCWPGGNDTSPGRRRLLWQG
jgi:hypothetical protein